MRYWLSGPRLLGGLVRPGISFSHREAKSWRAAPPPAQSAVAIIRRPEDGVLALCVAGRNGANEDVPGHTFAGVFLLPSKEDALAVRRGAQQRLGVPIADDSWVTGKSAGQVLAACRAEARDLGLEPLFARVKAAPPKKAEQSKSGFGTILFAVVVVVALLIWGVLVATG